jgi:hypothetical protein
MYFIRNGKFSVHVNTEHFQFDGKKVKQVKPVTYLIEGDHFGEIGMLFDCKRTATVRSEGYGGLVILKKNDYAELAKTF